MRFVSQFSKAQTLPSTLPIATNSDVPTPRFFWQDHHDEGVVGKEDDDYDDDDEKHDDDDELARDNDVDSSSVDVIVQRVEPTPSPVRCVSLCFFFLFV